MAAALVAVVVVGEIGGVAAAKKAPPTRPTTTAPRQVALGIPAPTPPRQQVQVPWGSPSREPLALGFGRVWVGSDGGVAVLDPVSMKQIAGVEIGLPVLSIASSPDGVWILSGGNGYPRLLTRVTFLRTT